MSAHQSINHQSVKGPPQAGHYWRPQVNTQRCSVFLPFGVLKHIRVVSLCACDQFHFLEKVYEEPCHGILGEFAPDTPAIQNPAEAIVPGQRASGQGDLAETGAGERKGSKTKSEGHSVGRVHGWTVAC